MLRSVLLALVVASLLGAAQAQTTAPATISYQGVLTDAAGAPVPDGPYTLTLGLHIGATGGAPVYAETHAVTTAGGVFAVEIGAGTPTTGTWATVHFDVSYWLATTVDGTTLTPRTRLLATPYARSLTPGARIGAPASGSALVAAGVIESTAGGVRYPDGTTQTTASTGFTLPYSASSAASGYLIDLTGTAAGTRGIQAVVTGTTALRGESSATTGAGVAGQATSATGVSYGGFFRSASTSGQAVFAQATSATGTTYGVYGQSSSGTGRGVYGTSPYIGVQGIGGDASSATYGGWFESASPLGYGVRGENTATTGSNYGIWGRTASTSGTGVFGTASATTGSTEGVYGTVPSTSGIGVRGHATATTGTTYGGYFRTYSSSGRGVYGWASASTGSTYGVYGQTASSAGSGVFGIATATSGTTYGGNFASASPTGRGVYAVSTGATGVGVQGVASSTTGVNYGGYFESMSTSGRAVVGEAEATTGTTYGGFFTSASASGYGLYANNTTASGYAGYFGDRVRVDNNMEFYDGSGDTSANILFDVDEGGEAPSIQLRRGTTTVLELDADHNGDSRVITQELEITGGADLAELFDVATVPDAPTPAPGMVVEIDPADPGRLVVASQPYSRLVAGVMSGAGGVEAGMVMGQRGSVADGAHAVALVGRVYVLVDAAHGAVRPGDFLTTSATPGHAMVARDPARQQGAVLGKAMTSLESGRGLVLVLVSLQ